MRYRLVGLVIVASSLVAASTAVFARGQLQSEEARLVRARAPAVQPSAGSAFHSEDVYALRAVGGVDVSPDGTHLIYSVRHSDRPGTPYTRMWIMEIATDRLIRLGSDQEGVSNPRWSPDSQRIAYISRTAEGSGVAVTSRDGNGRTLLAPVVGTNHHFPGYNLVGEPLAWSPDGTQIAFLSATPGPETEAASGDPMVITRYLYKPTSSERLARFDDNRRLHVFIADAATNQVRQLTSGHYYDHSIDWTPRGDEVTFISNRGPDPEHVVSSDIFAVSVSDGTVRSLTETKSAEYCPVWSPDGATIAYLGTTRSLTSMGTPSENWHVWLMDAAGGNGRDLGGTIDNSQNPPAWAPDGSAVYFTVAERGDTRLYRLSVAGGQPELVAPAPGERGSIRSFSVGKGGLLAYAMSTPEAPAELYLQEPGAAPRIVTAVNRELMGAKVVAEVESLVFESFDGREVEAFLTKPLGLTGRSKHPMIVMLKGGPHSQDGPHFNTKAQIYAGRGWAALMVNYRGSIGYGQELIDALWNDMNGGEAEDVLAAVDAALAKYRWIDGNRLGLEGTSYGGQLTNWLITRTTRFKAAIPNASIANLVSEYYMTNLRNWIPTKFGLVATKESVLPHEQWRPDEATPPRLLMDVLWERSPLRYVANVRTPTMLVHGENDSDCPIAEAEQYYIALHDAGVETIMVRYPREGHGLRESQHVVDFIDRSIAWYEKHFRGSGETAAESLD